MLEQHVRARAGRLESRSALGRPRSSHRLAAHGEQRADALVARAGGARTAASAQTAESSHWKSSTATRSGASGGEPLSTSRTASPIARGSAALLAAGAFDAAAPLRVRAGAARRGTAARRRRRGRAARRSPQRRGPLRPRPRDTRGRARRGRAPVASPACQSSDLPIPASPESTSSDGPLRRRVEEVLDRPASRPRARSATSHQSGIILSPGRAKVQGFPAFRRVGSGVGSRP